MSTFLHTVAWMRRDDRDGVALEELKSLSLRQAIRKSREVTSRAGFLAGQILGCDGRVLANFAGGSIKFNRTS